MKRLGILLIIFGCQEQPITDVMSTPLAGTPPQPCDLIEDISLPEDLTPGESFKVSLTVKEGYERVSVRWELSGFEEVQWGESVQWDIPPETSDLTNEDLTLNIGVGASGCLGETYSFELFPHWTESERVLVLYNSLVPDSKSVADAYADWRGIDEEQLCDLKAPDDETLTTGAFTPVFNRFRNCLFTLGNRMTYVVPVYGVPYRLDGRIEDYTTNEPTVTSLDSLLMFGQSADAFSSPVVNPVALEGDSANQSYDAYTSIGARRAELGAPYLVVSRLDGASAAAAIDLIERTKVAEAAEGDLSGVVYVDGRYGDAPPATDEAGSLSALEWNLWGARYAFEEMSDYTVVWDGNFEEVGDAPAPTSGEDALLYLGGFAPYGYEDVFDWEVGAIAAHMDKSSAESLRSDSWLTGALQAGLTAGVGVVSDPYPKGYLHVDQFSRYLLEGANLGEAAAYASPATAWQTVVIGDPLYRPFPNDEE